MNASLLAQLGRDARVFAQTYTSVKEELQREGVQIAEAQEVARHVATSAALMETTERTDPEIRCGSCGR